MHRAGRQVRFAPRALVMAESPSTLLGLWKQLVRWARGLLQTTLKHRDAVGDPRRGMFGLYLAFNTLTMIIMPGLQLLLALLPVLALGGENHLSTGFWAWLGWLGLVLTLVIARAAPRHGTRSSARAWSASPGPASPSACSPQGPRASASSMPRGSPPTPCAPKPGRR